MKRKPSLHTVLIIAALAGMAVLFVLMLVSLLPLLEEVVENAGDESQVTSYIKAYGAKGVPALVGLQALQVIIAVIPAQPIQVLAGLCYGTFLGAAICTAGFTLGNTLMFVAFRQFGHIFAPLVERHKGKPPKKGERAEKQEDGADGEPKSLADRLAAVPFVQKLMRRPVLAALVLFAVPGIPDGFILPYLFARTNITLPWYMLAVAAASMPAMLLFSFLGSRLSTGDWRVIIAVGVLLLVVGGVFLLVRRKMRRDADKRADGSR